MKGNRRELIQLGVPIFGQVKDDATNNNQTSTTFFFVTLMSNYKSFGTFFLLDFVLFVGVFFYLFYRQHRANAKST